MILAAGHAEAVPPQRVTAFPDGDARSGRFMNITRGLQSLGESATRVAVHASGASSQFELNIFDGDMGGRWDPMPPSGAADQVFFTLYADLALTGNTSAADQVAQWISTSMPDDDWFSAVVTNVPAAYDAGSNTYRYNLEITWATITNSNEQNNFKVKAQAAVFAPGGSSYGMIGYTPTDPLQSAYPSTHYDGSWSFWMELPEEVPSIELWDGDFDYALDSNDGNSPMAPPFPFASSTQPEGANPGLPLDDAAAGSKKRLLR